MTIKNFKIKERKNNMQKDIKNIKNTENMKKRIGTAEKETISSIPSPHKVIEQILNASEGYVDNCIMPKFTGISEDSDEWWFLRDFCQGAILADTLPVLDFTAIEHYKREDDTDYLVVEREDDTIYCFILDYGDCHNFIRYAAYNRDVLEQCQKSKFVGKELREIVKTYEIPLVREIPEILSKLHF